MEDKKTRQPILIDIGKITKTPEEPFLPLWFFQHDDLINAIDSGSHIKKENLINTLSRIHFTGDSIRALLRHPKYDEAILVEAIPEIIDEDELTCLWNKSHTSFGLENFQFSYVIVMEHQSIIVIPAKLLSMDGKGFKALLPEESYVMSRRRINRFPCHDVVVEVTQSGFLAKGNLVDFSPQSFRIKVSPEIPSSYHEFNPDATVTIRLTSDGKMLFSGDCRRLREKYEILDWEVVLAPLAEQIKRFQTRTVRHPRLRIYPPPMAVFEHPFFKRKVQREITDISITGFSVYDDAVDGILLPGLIIHGMLIIYAGELKMRCTAQVIYRKKQEGNKVCCGLAVLDMDVHSYSRLNRILALNMDRHSLISTEVDMDALWEFFFDTGFIYPKKYKLLQERREEFKDTYRKLYQENPEIAMHITYEENGRIYGHMSMIRAYERAWMIHHHAARPMENKLPGFQILKHMMLFVYGMYHLPSAKMDYVFCYFRPENKFPDRVFGGFAREMKDPRICSLDLFSYVTFPIETIQSQLPRDWSLHKSTKSELWQVEQFLKHSSGGYLFDVLNLGKKDPTDDSLENVSQRLGFTRRSEPYSLTKGNYLKAVLIVNQSDVGVNLSELLNGIKVLVIDAESMPWEVLSPAVAQLTGAYHSDSIPLLIYPSAYSDAEKIPSEKKYQLWVLTMRHFNPNKFMEYVQSHFRMRYE
jgi:PilZ domain